MVNTVDYTKVATNPTNYGYSSAGVSVLLLTNGGKLLLTDSRFLNISGRILRSVDYTKVATNSTDYTKP